MNSDYFTLANQFEETIVIERSKFICNVKNVINEEDAKDFVDKIRKIHSLATHNCYAYIADDKGLIQKFSDDGEPQGTAGMPMLDVLKNKKMYKTVAVVTRYFGGKKLGTGGLVRAYGGAVDSALNNAQILHMFKAVFLSVETDYDGYGKLQRLISQRNLPIINTDFDNGVKVDFVVKKVDFDKFSTEIIDYFNGKVNLTVIKEDFYPFK
jgi:uncharacterized YigZ family protein